jgi:hypothetical protein
MTQSTGVTDRQTADAEIIIFFFVIHIPVNVTMCRLHSLLDAIKWYIPFPKFVLGIEELLEYSNCLCG